MDPKPHDDPGVPGDGVDGGRGAAWRRTVMRGGRALTLFRPGPLELPASGTVRYRGHGYRVASLTTPAFPSGQLTLGSASAGLTRGWSRRRLRPSCSASAGSIRSRLAANLQEMSRAPCVCTKDVPRTARIPWPRKQKRPALTGFLPNGHGWFRTSDLSRVKRALSH